MVAWSMLAGKILDILSSTLWFRFAWKFGIFRLSMLIKIMPQKKLSIRVYSKHLALVVFCIEDWVSQRASMRCEW